MTQVITFNRNLTEDKNYFIISDLHFYHKNIMSFNADTRPYKDIEEMHEAIISNWNSVVNPDDVIFHLGDFSFAGKERTLEVLDQLNGSIVWILGNHDKVIRTQLGVVMFDYLEIKYKGHKIIMSHYPIACWNGQGRGSLHFHGHSHGNYSTLGRILDVGWDNIGKVSSLDEAVDSIKDIDVYTPDHHKIIK